MLRLLPPHPSSSFRRHRPSATHSQAHPHLVQQESLRTWQPLRLPIGGTLHPVLKRSLDGSNGISWGHMGVNGTELHDESRNHPCEPFTASVLYGPLRLTKRYLWIASASALVLSRSAPDAHPGAQPAFISAGHVSTPADCEHTNAIEISDKLPS